ncbi:MAG: hypothetical protein EOO11_13725 [Chitinophagaceae bacterium]|nr:MAG: hypothetical protein EOO11_13725 [Chitinophagaceae bacterium]
MSPKTTPLLLLLLCIGLHSRAQQHDAADAAKRWWHAVTFGDTAYVRAHSTGGLTVTFSNGRSFTHAAFLAQVAKHDPAAKITSEWPEVQAQFPAPKTAVLTSRVVERVGAQPNLLKYLTVLVSTDSGWQVAAAQSTRELELAPRLPAAGAGQPGDYAGAYRTPGGITLRVQQRDSTLLLIEPSGTETKLEPIGHGLFEGPVLLFAGNVRFAFNRDSTGKVVALTRIAHRVITMPRVP